MSSKIQTCRDFFFLHSTLQCLVIVTVGRCRRNRVRFVVLIHIIGIGITITITTTTTNTNHHHHLHAHDDHHHFVYFSLGRILVYVRISWSISLWHFVVCLNYWMKNLWDYRMDLDMEFSKLYIYILVCLTKKKSIAVTIILVCCLLVSLSRLHVDQSIVCVHCLLLPQAVIHVMQTSSWLEWDRRPNYFLIYSTVAGPMCAAKCIAWQTKMKMQQQRQILTM